MGKKVVVFWTMMMVTCCYATYQSPKAVEKWVKNLHPSQEKLTKLHFFCHHLHGATATTIARATTTDTSPTFFGLLDTRDDPLTVGPQDSSQIIGYAQGISAAASLEKISSYDPYTFVFTNKKYNGSTLAVLGSCPLFDPSCEAAVVGGSGVFRLARGFVTTTTYYSNFTTGKASLEVNVVALHY
nr:dirigent protein 14 [Phryma leptostachya subsp. asiatica]